MADKPFILRQQQTDDIVQVADVLANDIQLHSGADMPESTMEALYQAASGKGYDQDCDGNFDNADDVKPFLSSPLDAFRGWVPGASDPETPGTGENGGMGFRDNIFPIFIYATDADLRDPEAGYSTPGGCSQDASFYDVYRAIAELGGKTIGVGVRMSESSKGYQQMTELAIVTDSYGDMNGDYVEEPAVVTWSGSNAEFRETIVDAVYGLTGSAWFNKVTLELDGAGATYISEVDPEAYYDIQAGTPVTFTLKVDGSIIEEPMAGSQELLIKLVADDQLILSTRNLYVMP